MIPKRDWDSLIKPVLLEAIEALEAVSWNELAPCGTRQVVKKRIKAKRNIRKLIAEIEGKEDG